MVFLFKVGKYISVPIISEWLVIEDYLKLDTALGKVDRQQFIEQLTEYSHLFSSLLFPFDNGRYYSPKAVAWASKRRLEFPVAVTNEFLHDLDLADAVCWNNVLRIKCINISVCYQEKLLSLFVFCESLESIIIRDTLGIDEYALQLSVCCPKLKSVDFSYCIELSDYSIIALCRACPRLSTLELWKCTELTPSVVHAVIVHCRDIAYFRIDNTGYKRDSQMLYFHTSPRGKITPLDAVFDYLLGESYIQYGTLKVPEEVVEECPSEDEEPQEEENEEEEVEETDYVNEEDEFGDEGVDEGEYNTDD